MGAFPSSIREIFGLAFYQPDFFERSTGIQLDLDHEKVEAGWAQTNGSAVRPLLPETKGT